LIDIFVVGAKPESRCYYISFVYAYSFESPNKVIDPAVDILFGRSAVPINGLQLHAEFSHIGWHRNLPGTGGDNGALTGLCVAGDCTQAEYGDDKYLSGYVHTIKCPFVLILRLRLVLII